MVDKYEFFGELLQIYGSVSQLSNIDYLNEANKRLFVMENSHYKPTKLDTQRKPPTFCKQ